MMVMIKMLTVIALCVITSSAFVLGSCAKGENKYDPYKGSLADLISQRFEQYELAEFDKDFYRFLQHRDDAKDLRVGMVDAAKAKYKDANGKRVVLRIFNYESSDKAASVFDQIVKGTIISARGKWELETKISREGFKGKRAAQREFIFWTNGSLLCQMEINDVNHLGFEKLLPY